MRENTKPATLFLCVAPDGKTDCVRIIRDRTGEDDFRRFIDSLLDASLQTDASVPDDWVFRYIIPDGGLLPTLETGRDHSDYHHRLRHLDTLAELRPANVVALRNAALCRRSGIDPLSAEGSDRELVLGETDPRSFPSVRAVELAPNRVLLYDMSETVGCDAYRSLHQHIADHFFDREIQTETLRLYDLHSFFDTSVLMKHIPALNFNFNHYSRGRCAVRRTDDRHKDIRGNHHAGTDLYPYAAERDSCDIYGRTLLDVRLRRRCRGDANVPPERRVPERYGARERDETDSSGSTSLGESDAFR